MQSTVVDHSTVATEGCVNKVALAVGTVAAWMAEETTSPTGLIRLITQHHGLGHESNHFQCLRSVEHIVETTVPLGLVGPEVAAKDRSRHIRVERQDFCSSAQAHMVQQSGRSVPIDNAERTARFAAEIVRKGRPANNPARLAIPVKPHRRLARPIDAGVSQMRKKRPGHELGEIKNVARARGDFLLDDFHVT